MSDTLREIAAGGSFDTTCAIRELARALVDMSKKQTMESREPTKTLVEPFGGYFNPRLASTLKRAGYGDLQSLAGVSDDELFAIDGIGQKAVEMIRDALEGER